MLILIAGGTSSGKGGVGKRIINYFQQKGQKASLLSTDDYNNTDFNWPTKYKGPDGRIDFDNKEAHAYFYKTVYDFYTMKNFTESRLIDDINAVNSGKDVVGQLNKAASGNLEPTKVEANSHIVVEGCHALQSEEIREKADLKIYCDVDDDVRLSWKIMRSPYYKKMVGKNPEDRRNFGGSLPLSLEQWHLSIRGSHKNYIEPTKQYADLVVAYEDWDGFNDALQMIYRFIDLYFKNKTEFKKQLAKERESAQMKLKRKGSQKLIDELEKKIKDAQHQREREREIILNDWEWNASDYFFGNFVSDILGEKKVNQVEKIVYNNI